MASNGEATKETIAISGLRVSSSPGMSDVLEVELEVDGRWVLVTRARVTGGTTSHIFETAGLRAKVAESAPKPAPRKSAWD